MFSIVFALICCIFCSFIFMTNKLSVYTCAGTHWPLASDVRYAHWHDVLHVDPTLLLFLEDREIAYSTACIHVRVVSLEISGNLLLSFRKFLTARHSSTENSMTLAGVFWRPRTLPFAPITPTGCNHQGRESLPVIDRRSNQLCYDSNQWIPYN